MSKKNPDVKVIDSHAMEFVIHCAERSQKDERYGIHTTNGVIWGMDGARMAIVSTNANIQPLFGKKKIIEQLEDVCLLTSSCQSMLGKIPKDGPDHSVSLSQKVLLKNVVNLAKNQMFPVVKICCEQDGEDYSPQAVFLDRYWAQDYIVPLECSPFGWEVTMSFKHFSAMVKSWVSGDEIRLGRLPSGDACFSSPDGMVVGVLTEQLQADYIEDQPQLSQLVSDTKKLAKEVVVTMEALEVITPDELPF